MRLHGVLDLVGFRTHLKSMHFRSLRLISPVGWLPSTIISPSPSVDVWVWDNLSTITIKPSTCVSRCRNLLILTLFIWFDVFLWWKTEEVENWILISLDSRQTDDCWTETPAASTHVNLYQKSTDSVKAALLYSCTCTCSMCNILWELCLLYHHHHHHHWNF